MPLGQNRNLRTLFAPFFLFPSVVLFFRLWRYREDHWQFFFFSLFSEELDADELFRRILSPSGGARGLSAKLPVLNGGRGSSPR